MISRSPVRYDTIGSDSNRRYVLHMHKYSEQKTISFYHIIRAILDGFLGLRLREGWRGVGRGGWAGHERREERGVGGRKVLNPTLGFAFFSSIQVPGVDAFYVMTCI